MSLRTIPVVGALRGQNVGYVGYRCACDASSLRNHTHSCFFDTLLRRTVDRSYHIHVVSRTFNRTGISESSSWVQYLFPEFLRVPLDANPVAKVLPCISAMVCGFPLTLNPQVQIMRASSSLLVQDRGDYCGQEPGLCRTNCISALPTNSCLFTPESTVRYYPESTLRVKYNRLDYSWLVLYQFEKHKLMWRTRSNISGIRTELLIARWRRAFPSPSNPSFYPAAGGTRYRSRWSRCTVPTQRDKLSHCTHCTAAGFFEAGALLTHGQTRPADPRQVRPTRR